MKPPKIDRLTELNLAQAVEWLGTKDARLGQVVQKYGGPPLWARTPNFATLVHIILEQQVSLASAKACFDKLQNRLGQVDPKGLLALTDSELLELGFSRQKTRYIRILAQSIVAHQLVLDDMEKQTDETVFTTLTALTGIGPWTANIFLLMGLGRPDIWPGGDLALVIALQELFGLSRRPDAQQFNEIGEGFRPYRSVAARILWHYYLSR